MKSLFSPRRILQFSRDTVKPSGYLGTKQWVISRSLCLYKKFFIGNIPAGEQKSALDLQITRWSSFEHTGRYVVWKNDTAMVWIWDESRRMDIAGTTGGGRWTVIPESLLLLPPEDDVLLMISCMEGFEAQIWGKKVLRVSRWWEALPNEETWHNFLLLNDLDPSLGMPEPRESFCLDKPWAKSSSQTVFGVLKKEKLLVSVSFFLMFFWLSWSSMACWRYYYSTKELENRIQSVSAKIEPILEARTHALEQSDNAQKLRSFLDAPSQMSMMAKVSEVLPGKKAILNEWHYTHNKLSVVVEGKNQNPLVYVKKIQAIPDFKNVIVTQGKNQNILKISMDVVRDRT